MPSSRSMMRCVATADASVDAGVRAGCAAAPLPAAPATFRRLSGVDFALLPG